VAESFGFGRVAIHRPRVHFGRPQRRDDQPRQPGRQLTRLRSSAARRAARPRRRLARAGAVKRRSLRRSQRRQGEAQQLRRSPARWAIRWPNQPSIGPNRAQSSPAKRNGSSSKSSFGAAKTPLQSQVDESGRVPSHGRGRWFGAQPREARMTNVVRNYIQASLQNCRWTRRGLISRPAPHDDRLVPPREQGLCGDRFIGGETKKWDHIGPTAQSSRIIAREKIGRFAGDSLWVSDRTRTRDHLDHNQNRAGCGVSPGQFVLQTMGIRAATVGRSWPRLTAQVFGKCSERRLCVDQRVAPAKYLLGVIGRAREPVRCAEVSCEVVGWARLHTPVRRSRLSGHETGPLIGSVRTQP